MSIHSHIEKESGFTLVELMIAVAIIAIIAALALNTFVTIAMRSKAAEASVNLSTIRKAQESYRAENDQYLTCPANPIAWVAGSSEPRAWDTPSAPWDTIGFEPDGYIRYQYAVTGNPSTYTATASGDMDTDAAPVVLTLSNDPIGEPLAAAQYPKPLKVGDDY